MDAWYVLDRSVSPPRPTGPFPFEELRRRAGLGSLRAQDLVARAGSTDWIAAAGDPVLAPLFGASPPTEFDSARAGILRVGQPGTRTFPPYSFSGAFSLATSTFSSQWATLVLIGLVGIAISAVIAVPSWITTVLGELTGDAGAKAGISLLGSCSNLLLQVLVGGPLWGGWIVAGANAVEGRGDVSDVFAGFRRYSATVVAYLLTMLISLAMGIVIGVPLVIVVALAAAIERSGSGPAEAIVVIGAIVAVVAALFFLALVLVRVILAAGIAADPAFGPVGGGEALRIAWRASQGLGWSMFGLLLVVGLLAALSVLLLCVGYFLIGVPLMLGATGAMHVMINRRAIAAPLLPA